MRLALTLRGDPIGGPWPPTVPPDPTAAGLMGGVGGLMLSDPEYGAGEPRREEG